MSLRFEILPADLDATVAFYTSVLDFAVTRDERDVVHPYVGMQRDDVRVGAVCGGGVVNPAHRRPPTGVELVLEVDDVVAERRRVADAGWAVDEDLQRRAWALTDFRLLDPSGYFIRVTSRD